MSDTPTDEGRGTPDEYEIAWRTGKVDRVLAHQVSWSGGAMFFSVDPSEPERFRLHAEIDGRWRLMLDGLVSDVLSIRNLTHVGDQP